MDRCCNMILSYRLRDSQRFMEHQTERSKKGPPRPPAEKNRRAAKRGNSCSSSGGNNLFQTLLSGPTVVNGMISRDDPFFLQRFRLRDALQNGFDPGFSGAG